jgi:hypothetical protein
MASLEGVFCAQKTVPPVAISTRTRKIWPESGRERFGFNRFSTSPFPFNGNGLENGLSLQ